MVHKVQKARLPAHELVSKRMNDLTRKSQRVTQRALDLLEWVAEVKIPKEHVGVVAASMQAMIDRLGGTHSRRFKNRYRQIAIDKPTLEDYFISMAKETI